MDLKKFVALPALVYSVSSVLISTGIMIAVSCDEGHDVTSTIGRADALNYQRVMVEGYSYDERFRSNVAFFPVFPLIARAVHSLGIFDATTSLLVTSNVMRFLGLLVFCSYLRTRASRCRSTDFQFENDAANVSCPTRLNHNEIFSMLAFGLLPTTFFFQMPYSESCFFFLTILCFYAMLQNWSHVILAILVGLTVVARPVGVAMLPCFLIHVYFSSPSASLLRIAMMLPIANWGLIAFMLYQYSEFGDPLAFARTQQHWTVLPVMSVGDRVLSLLSWESIWGTYTPGSPYYWDNNSTNRSPFLTLTFFNPIYFLTTVLLTAFGYARRIITRQEALFSALLILIPYLTRAYEWGMQSEARFMAVVFPCYIVIGNILSRSHWCVAMIALTTSGIGLVAYTAMYCLGYPFF